MPFFAANISDGYMFGKKPIQDRIASCRSMELEAIEINNPYNTSPSHLAALLHNDETGESLQLVSIDTYNGPIDAPISNYAENDINDFMNQGGNQVTISEGNCSDTSSIAATTQASMAYLNSDHKIFPRDQLDGYASIPGALFAFNNSLATTFTYASIINVPCVNILPGTITHHNPTHHEIFNEIISKSKIVWVNNTNQSYHDPRCASSCTCLRDGQAVFSNTPTTTSSNTTSPQHQQQPSSSTDSSQIPSAIQTSTNPTHNECHNASNDSCPHQTGYTKPTNQDFIAQNPCYNLLYPSPIETQELCCCPPFSMVVSVTIPLYLTQSLTTPTVIPKILCILPLPHAQSMQSIIDGSSTTTTTATTPLTKTSPGQSPNVPFLNTGKLYQNVSGAQTSSTTSCSVLSKHYGYLAKTQHLNNKSYFLMKRLLPPNFLLESSHNLVDVFHNSFYLHEVVELYQHYYADLYRILNKDGSSNIINPTPIPNLSSSSGLNPNSPAIAGDLYQDFSTPDSETTFQKLSAFQVQFHKNLLAQQQISRQVSTPMESIMTPNPFSREQRESNKQDSGQQQQGRESKQSEPKSHPSPFVSLTFPIHGAYTPTSQLHHVQSSSHLSITSPFPGAPALDQSSSQPQQTSSSRDQGLDLSSSRFDFFLTSLIFTTLVFNVKFAARNATRSDRLRDHLSLTLSLTPQSYINTVFRLLRVMVFCSSDNIGILYDVSAMYQQHGNIISLFERLSPLIRHVRVSNQHQELDNTILFNTIHQYNYTGWVSLDFSMTNTSIPTKKLLQPWFSHYLRRRNGSAGVLFMCRGKQGKVYFLLGKETKHGQKTVGPFWGRPDKTDADIEMTAVRETIEESLGCVVNNATVLYSALKNKGFFYKCPRINLYLVNIGVLGVKERNDVVSKYSQLRRIVVTNGGDSLAGLSPSNQQFNFDPTSPNLNQPTQRVDKQLNKSLMEMNDVTWVDLYDMYKHYMLKSHRVLSEYGIVIDTVQPASPTSPPAASAVTSPKSPIGDDDDKKKKKKDKDTGKDDKKEKKKKKKDKDGNDDGDEDGGQYDDLNNTSGGNLERETVALQSPHNNEHTITSLVNTIIQERGNYNNLPLRRFFLREMVYMWLTDPNWLNLVHRRDFPIHSIERLMQLHKQYVAEKEKTDDSSQTQPKPGNSPQQPQSPQQLPPRQTNSRAVGRTSPSPDDDISSKQWRSAPL